MPSTWTDITQPGASTWTDIIEGPSKGTFGMEFGFEFGDMGAGTGESVWTDITQPSASTWSDI